MTLRPYREEDWFAVRDIYDLSKPDEMRGVLGRAAILPLEVDESMKQLFTESQITVADDADRTVGFAGNRGSFITWLFVHPSFRRRGVATALVQSMLSQLDRPISLNVAIANVAAICLYERLGFTVERHFLGEFQGHPCKAARLRHD